MKTHDKHRLAKLIKQCPQGCKCREAEVEGLCMARDIGLKTFVECLEERPFECESSISYGRVSYCCCRARVYIARSLNENAGSFEEVPYNQITRP
jgi:hypothetical protein